MKTITPPIGEPRLYDGATIPILYPGETATARVDPAALHAAVLNGDHEVPVMGWTVEPAPGWKARWLRVRYRVWGRWFATGRARLEATMRAMPVRDEDGR